MVILPLVKLGHTDAEVTDADLLIAALPVNVLILLGILGSATDKYKPDSVEG